MTRIDRYKPVKHPVFEHPLVGYALIAFALAVGHAYAQGITWDDSTNPHATQAIMTSAYVPGPSSSAESRVGRDGMVAPMSIGAADDSLQQPLLIRNTECGLYAVSREFRDDAPGSRQLSI